MHGIIEPFQYPFMHNGLLAAILIGLVCAMIGVYVVLRGMAFIGDAMAHAALPGIAFAYFRGWNMYVGAVAAGILTALGIAMLTRRRSVREDTAIGILFSGMFALGIWMVSRQRSFRNFTHMLFGNILGVTSADLWLLVGVAAAVIVTLILLHKELELTSVDPTHAQAIGLKADRLRLVLLVLLALVVMAGIQAVGVVMTSALLVTPAATAALLTRRLVPMMLVAAGVAVFSSIAGLYLSYYFQAASGAAIVLVCTGVFAAVWTVQHVRK
jgi:manganese/iron transport system permease protein